MASLYGERVTHRSAKYFVAICRYIGQRIVNVCTIFVPPPRPPFIFFFILRLPEIIIIQVKYFNKRRSILIFTSILKITIKGKKKGYLQYIKRGSVCADLSNLFCTLRLAVVSTYFGPRRFNSTHTVFYIQHYIPVVLWYPLILRL